MLYHLLYPLHTTFSFFNVFRYITFRTICAAITALIICFIIGPWLIRKLQSLKVGQSIREDGPQSHQAKKGTPTMGGILIIFAVVISTLLWSNLTVSYIWLALLALVGFGVIGFCDDYRKLARQDSKGISAKVRLFAEIAIASFIAVVLYAHPDFGHAITIPFFKTFLPDIGIFYIFLAVFIIVGTANAVNLTDGLDGLAIGPAITCFMTYLLFSYLVGNIIIAQYLQIPFVSGAGELTIFCGAVVGAGIGFLWYNTYPAE
ncbi:MAG: phospho-N-acetylmuramoyl-pentapeptide-transferase, partial [Syntrophobacterales bacterium]|nr:phospho-N-acetylmuramoyl-pentapeptide-transferase [Syntrophobacterales bacterium]